MLHEPSNDYDALKVPPSYLLSDHLNTLPRSSSLLSNSHLDA